VPGLPVTPALDSAWDALDRELADLLTDPDQRPDHGSAPGSGSVGTLDRDTGPTARPPTDRPGSTRRPPRTTRQTRSIEALRAELRARIEADPNSIDPTSAESIRRALRCSPARARRLRDDHQSGEKEA
jgi:hypothetical protein